MVNYYRAARRAVGGRLPPINAPTLVIWGERDRYLGAELAEPHRRDVPGLREVVRLADSSHWVMRDEPERIATLLAEFFGEERPRSARRLRRPRAELAVRAPPAARRRDRARRPVSAVATARASTWRVPTITVATDARVTAV